MKNINIHNYEEYALEFINGELDEEGMDVFSDFLGDHPDIADDILLFDLDQDIKKEPVFKYNELKKNLTDIKITPQNFEEYCIASIEGDLDTKGETKLLKYIGDNKALKQEYKLLSKCKLTDKTLTFPNKETLIRKQHKPLLTRRIIGIASSIVAASIIAFVFFITPTNKPLGEELAMVPTFKTYHPVPQKIKKASPTKEEEEQETLEKDEKTSNTPAKETKKSTETLIKENSYNNDQVSEKTVTETLPTLKHKQTTIKSYPITINKLNIAEPTLKSTQLIAQTNSNDFRKKATNYLYTTILSRGVNGINKMTETELDYKVIEDENGDPVKLIIKSRFGEINHTLAQR